MKTMKFRLLAQTVDGTGFQANVDIPIEKGLSDDELVELVRNYYFACIAKSNVDPAKLRYWTTEVDYPFEWISFSEMIGDDVVVRISARNPKNYQHKWKADNYCGIWEKQHNLDMQRYKREAH